MNYAVSPLISAVHYPPISEVRQWAAVRGDHPELPLIDLCQAVPDYAPAAELTHYLAEVVTDPLTARYTPMRGCRRRVKPLSGATNESTERKSARTTSV
jgi:hypothetical protein